MSKTAESAEIVIYQTPDGETSIDVTVVQDTVWLTAVQLSELFNNSRQNIGLHLKHIFEEGELDRGTTVRETSVLQVEGKRTIQRTVEQYSLDVSRKLADNALVALTLMIAESKPDEKEMMTRVVVNLINLKN